MLLLWLYIICLFELARLFVHQIGSICSSENQSQFLDRTPCTVFMLNRIFKRAKISLKDKCMAVICLPSNGELMALFYKIHNEIVYHILEILLPTIYHTLKLPTGTWSCPCHVFPLIFC